MGSIIINPTFDPSWSGAPAGATACLNQVFADFVRLLKPAGGNNLTVNNLKVGWGEVNGSTISGATAESQWSVNNLQTYSTIRTKLLTYTNNNPISKTAFTSSNIPSTSFFPTNNFWLTEPQWISLFVAGNGTTSGVSAIGFNSSANFDLDQHGDTCGAGKISLYGTAWHELSEVFGRVAFAGAQQTNTYTILDFFTYNFNTTRNVTTSNSRALSADGGTTFISNLNQNNVAGGDDGGDEAFGTSSVFADNSGWILGVVNPMGTLPPGSNATTVANNLKTMALAGWDLTTDGLSQAQLNPGVAPFTGLGESFGNFIGASENSQAFSGTGASLGTFHGHNATGAPARLQLGHGGH